ncbi:MAG: hypothetical protein EU549_04650 [Promethearchaeota archaeon]|nr:MAG: hypothetical protein EU549_04650 [Candidatus Lokiarchaeota archaeon]
MKEGGEFVIWGLKIPKKVEKAKEYYGITLSVDIGSEKISTGYAVRWNKDQNYDQYAKLAKKVGFALKEHQEERHIFFIRFVKIR